MSQYLIVTTTVADQPAADRLAEALVEERLAACVQSAPVRSCYRWQGAIRHEAEIQLTIKTKASAAEALRARLLALHPYELPEVLIVPVWGGSAGYLSWLDESVGR